MDCQISLIDGQITLRVDDFVVDACTILEADIFHIDGIRIRLFIGISCRTSSLVAIIETARLDGKFTGALVELIIIDKGFFALYAFLLTGERCSEFPVIDGCGTVGLAAAAVDVDLAFENLDCAAILCGCTGVAARFAFIRQTVAIRSSFSSFDVVNRIVLRFTGRCFIAARTRCGLCPAFARERTDAIVVAGYLTFVEGTCIFVDVMLFVILSGKGCLSGGRDIVTRQFFAVVFTVDFHHVFGGDIDGRLYLEDVLIRIFCLIVLIETGAFLRAGMPAGCRPAVEVHAELVAVWRYGVDFPVAVRIDGFLCLRRIRCIMEGTICTACVDDDRIVCIRRGNQCATALGIIRQSNRAIAIRIGRDQANLIAILDAMDRDIIRRFDGNKAIRCNLAIDRNIFICSRRGNLNLFICGDLSYIDIALRRNFDIAIYQIRSGIRIVIVNINGIENLDIACSRFSFNRDVAQTCTYAAAQLSSIGSSFCTDRNITSAAVDRKSRVWQFCLTDKAVNRTCAVVDIVPAILIGPANSNIRLFR